MPLAHSVLRLLTTLLSLIWLLGYLIELIELIRQHLLRAKQRMKKNADLQRSERQFELNDWVYLKFQPYVQSSLAEHSHHKLAFRFFRPYRILAKVGSVAYRL